MRQDYTPKQQTNGCPSADIEPLESVVEFSEQDLETLEVVRAGRGHTEIAEAAHEMLRRHLRDGVNKLAARRSRLRLVKGAQP